MTKLTYTGLMAIKKLKSMSEDYNFNSVVQGVLKEVVIINTKHIIYLTIYSDVNIVVSIVNGIAKVDSKPNTKLLLIKDISDAIDKIKDLNLEIKYREIIIDDLRISSHWQPEKPTLLKRLLGESEIDVSAVIAQEMSIDDIDYEDSQFNVSYTISLKVKDPKASAKFIGLNRYVGNIRETIAFKTIKELSSFLNEEIMDIGTIY